ncbi:IclR family transcriptional regulator [Formosimonas limnophila]|uniref:IclR family transcriptional regulator n=1 Tax=Formosimonas limnophila TaxID=1384487 RepID=A0A8J3CG55_9BURK|nr:IclR family transcriptional regulator [Formosimonas limnophila]GHA66780.1 IclR family transcriptional regulator [Formosimonas limnophila]
MHSNDTPTPMLRPTIQVLERTNDLLNVLARHNQALSLKLLAEQTNLHVSTAHRILNDLVLARIVDRPSAGHYQLGMRLLELGNLVKARLNVRDVALPIMKALHQQTRQTINLSVRQNDEIIYIERAYSERSGMQVVRAIGGRAPLHLTSVGKLFLAQDDKTALLAYANRTQLKGQTKNSLSSLEKITKELDKVRLDQFARDREELELGVSCMAAGIYDDNQQLVAGLSISAPAERVQESWVSLLQTAALDISKAMGYTAQNKTLDE